MAGAEEPAPSEAPYEVIVVAEDGVPHEPGSAHVLHEEELKRQGYDDVHAILAGVPGVNVRSEDGVGLRPNIGMRGANSDRSAKVTLLEDGVPIAPAPYAAPAAYYFPLPMRFVALEVYKGPSALRHGPQTIGGTLNVVTRRVPRASQGMASVGVGTFRNVSAHAWGAVANDRAGLLLESANLVSGGFKDLDGGGPTGFQRQDLMLKGRLNTDDDAPIFHLVEIKLGFGHESSDETYLGLTQDDFATTPYRRYAASALDRMAWDRTAGELSWQCVSGDDFDARVVLWQHHLDRRWTKFNRFAGGPDPHALLQDPALGPGFVDVLAGDADTVGVDDTLLIGTNDRVFDNAGVRAVAHHRWDRGPWRSALEVGLVAMVDDVGRLHTETPFAMVDGALRATGDPTSTVLDSATQAMAVAPHVVEDISLGPVHLVPGVRVESARTSAGTHATGPIEPVTDTLLLPGVATLVDLGAAEVFAGVHRGASPVPPGSEPEARPELAWSTEAGARLATRRTHAELIGFWSAYSNLTGTCTLSGGCSSEQLDLTFNGGAATVVGMEALLRHEVPIRGEHRLGGQISATWTQARFDTGFASDFPQFGTVVAGDALPYVPGSQGALHLFHAHERGGVSATLRHRAWMRDEAGQDAFDAAADVPASWLLDASGELALGARTQAWLHATNLLDAVVLESWRPYGARPAAPRQVMVGVRATTR